MIRFRFRNRTFGFAVIALLLSFNPVAGLAPSDAYAQTESRNPMSTYTRPGNTTTRPITGTRTDSSGRTTFIRPPTSNKSLLVPAQKLVTQADANCEVIDVAHRPKDSVIRNGKALSGQIYEVACQNTLGYLLLAKGSKLSEAVPCHISWELRAENDNSYACRILANRYSPDWISERANAKLPDCGAVDALWINGFGKDTSIIEVSCANGLGGVLSFPSRRDTTDNQVSLISCLKLLESESRCQNTDAAQAARTFSALFKTELPACTINNGRFIGANSTAEFYEIGCEDAQPFILATTASGQFVTVLSCDKAASAGGCQFATETKAASESAS
ncbi:MAG: hypothetical protein QM645_08900 [Asticcacaulis sp.]